MSGDVIKKILPNGLTVQLKEIHTAPIISHWIWYRVGSRSESAGRTGISHWVEHMQFKGTPQFPAGILDKAISREGGYWNAFTYLDWTAYFETMPADKINLALHLEADRMVNSIYDTEEVESERTVVISEREGDENEPLFRLGEAVQSAAFDKHPYRHEIIGLKKDLENIRRDQLFEHYRKHYHPSNAVLAVAGDFIAAEMLVLIEEVYGAIPSGKLRKLKPKAESEPGSERRIVLNGPGETTYLQLAYRAPAAWHPDFFILTVVDSLLTGPSSLNMFGGGGISNKTSRLYRVLVERELAVSVSGGVQATIDPFLYYISPIIHPSSTWEKCLEVLDGEIQRLQDSLVPMTDIQRAIKQARALFAYGSENITNQAFWLGFAEMFATYAWFLNYLDELEKVTPEEVQRVARQYLTPQRRVVGAYIPDGKEPG